MKNLEDYRKDGVVYFMCKDNGCTDTLILNETLIEHIDGNHNDQLSFWDLTAKGYASKKRIDTGVKLIKVAEFEDREWGEVVVLDKEQIEILLSEYTKPFKTFASRYKEMDVACAIGLAGAKYGWIEDRIDEFSF